MPKYAHYVGEAPSRRWHVDARVYNLDPPMLVVGMPAILAEIVQIVVSGVRENTGQTAQIGDHVSDVWRLHTVVCTADCEISLFEAWVEGRLDHEAALNQMGYHMIGKP